MEYSPMMIILLWALTPSDCYTLRDNPAEEAVVKEMPRPSMTIQNPQEFRLPGYFTFNDGKPFLVEKDPLTGAIDLNLKTTPVESSKFPPGPNEDYFYEDEDEFNKDQIDRKDSNIGSTNNDIKNQADLHKFLNLPVHYSTHGKYPLISSSYANTKVQGHGSSGLSNHRPYSAPSTVTPTYYTLWSGSTVTTQASISEKTTTSTTPKPEVTKTSTAAYEYEYIDYDYDKFEMESDSKRNATTKPPPVTFKTTPKPISTTSDVISIRTTTLQPNIKIVTSSTNQETTSGERNTPSVMETTVNESKDQYKNKTMEKTHSTNTQYSNKKEGYKNITEMMITGDISENPEILTFESKKTDKLKVNVTSFNVGERKNVSSQEIQRNPQLQAITEKNVNQKFSTDSYQSSLSKGTSASSITLDRQKVPHDNLAHPRPVGAGPSSNEKDRPYVTYAQAQPSESNIYTQTVSSNYLDRRPPSVGENTASISRPPTVGLKPPGQGMFGTGIKQQHFSNVNVTTVYPEQTVKSDNEQEQKKKVPATISDDKHIYNLRPPPSHYHNFKPSRPDSHFIPPDYHQTPPHIPNEKYETTKVVQPQIEIAKVEVNKQESTENPNLTKRPFIQGTVLGNTDEMFFKVQPEHRLPLEEPTRFTQFQQPTQIDNHFIRVSPGQVNPSYSLQTSFSIGVPPPDSEYPKENPRPGQGVGQVLFPDDEVFQKPELNKRPNVWSSERPTVPHSQTFAGPSVPHSQTFAGPSVPHSQTFAGPSVPHSQTFAGPSVPHSQTFAGPSVPHSQTFAGQRPQRPPQRLPVTELHTPVHSTDNYPRPQWESHLKPPHFFNHGNPLQKLETHSPTHTHQPPKRVKPGVPQRHDLPNILPQFRPNAKIGHGEYHAHFSGPMTKPREPLDTLQPPPLPRPQHLRLNRNEDAENTKNKEYFPEKISTELPLVHRRTGPQANSRVTTLQMMQQGPPRRAIVRAEYKDRHSSSEKDEPVFVVYPSNGGTKNIIPNDEVVVVGTRGAQRPLPPDNLDLDDDLDSFPLDDNKNFQIHAKDRIDTPILKTKPTPKPIIKNEFPYPLVKPTEVVDKEDKIHLVTKEYTAFSPTEYTNADEIKDHDSEINLIPYLQDYMPFATKKPIHAKPVEVPVWNLEGKPTLKPISVTLNTKLGTTGSSGVLDKYDSGGGQIVIKPGVEGALLTGSNSDYPTKPSLSTSTKYPIVSYNHRPAETSLSTSISGPQPQDFQAPFHASLSAPSQGWTIVSTQNPKEPEKEDKESSTEKTVEESKFDIENFKPQLFGGFKPIIPPILNENKGVIDDKKNPERQERVLFYI